MDIKEIKKLKDTTEKHINALLGEFYGATGLRINSISVEIITGKNKNTGEEYMILQRSKLNIEV